LRGLFTRRGQAQGARAAWDLTALLNAADARAPIAERHLWLVRMLEWLRHAPLAPASPGETAGPTPLPVLRLKHLLNVLERSPPHRVQVAGLLARFWAEIDMVALFADFGFSPRMDFFGELGLRLRARLLPMTPATRDLGELFGLLFPHAGDARWLAAIDDATLERLADLLGHELARDGHWTRPIFDAIVYLAAAVGAAGFSGPLRQRMSPELLAGAPFRQIHRVAEQLQTEAEAGGLAANLALRQTSQYLRALLDTCRRCADSVHDHLEEHGVSVDVVFEVDQLRERTHRIEELLNCVLSPHPQRELVGLLGGLMHGAQARRSLRALFAQHYSLLARKVAERSAETGEHYITRDRAAYRTMFAAALGGGAVIAGTTFLKFFLGAVGLTAFWGGFAAGMNYAASFLLVHLLHWTVATKQPAMTAPAMADKLSDMRSDTAVEAFVDEVTHLIRSQSAGIFGNLGAVIPVVLAVQGLALWAFGEPLVSARDAEYVLHANTLLGPTALFAAFTGMLLFISSLVAGWAENWFVWHRLDSAIAWNPRIVARLGAVRAQRLAAYWRANISGLASNVSLGLMLGLVPAVLAFFGIPLEVRHVTLATGQLAAAVGTLGWGTLATAGFWWCAVAIVAIGVLNLGVSFLLAFRVALRSRGIRLADRSRIYRAIRSRLRHRPLDFLVPPR
jgi:site-specific recombinase